MEVEWPRIRNIKYTDNFSMKRDDYCTCMLPWANKYTYEIKREGREIYDNGLNLTNRMATKSLIDFYIHRSFPHQKLMNFRMEFVLMCQCLCCWLYIWLDTLHNKTRTFYKVYVVRSSHAIKSHKLTPSSVKSIWII